MTRMRLYPSVLIEAFENADSIFHVHSYHNPFTGDYTPSRGREPMVYEYSKRNGSRIVEWSIDDLDTFQSIMELEGWKSTNKYKWNLHIA